LSGSFNCRQPGGLIVAEHEIRITHRKQPAAPRLWRTREDPFEDIWSTVQHWLNEEGCHRQRTVPALTTESTRLISTWSAANAAAAGQGMAHRSGKAARAGCREPAFGQRRKPQRGRFFDGDGGLPPNPRDLTLSGGHVRMRDGRSDRPIMPAPEPALRFHPWRALSSVQAPSVYAWRRDKYQVLETRQHSRKEHPARMTSTRWVTFLREATR
jgi:hypothetical protein